MPRQRDHNYCVWKNAYESLICGWWIKEKLSAGNSAVVIKLSSCPGNENTHNCNEGYDSASIDVDKNRHNIITRNYAFLAGSIVNRYYGQYARE